MSKPIHLRDTAPPEFQAGALACLDAIKQLQRVRWGGIGFEQYCANRETAAAAIIEAAGPVTDRAAGVLALLAEFLIDLQDSGENNADTWIPDVLMAPDQFAEYRQELRHSWPEALHPEGGRIAPTLGGDAMNCVKGCNPLD